MLRSLPAFALLTALCSLLLPACGSGDEGDPETCQGYGAAGAAECAETHYWRTFQREFDDRAAAVEIISSVIDEHPAEEVYRVYFLRGTLATAMLSEDGDDQFSDTIVDDLRTAERYGSSRAYFYKNWRLLMELLFLVIDPSSDPDELQAVVDENIAHGEADLMNNMLALSQTWSAMPMSTGLPQKAVELLDRWDEMGRPVDKSNDDHYPYLEPGLGVHIADSYLRMGEVETARSYLEEALDAEGADVWPYRSVAEDVLDTLEERAANLANVPEDSMALGYFGVGGEQTCRICHAYN